MNEQRNMHKSVIDKVRASFLAPPATTGLSPYTVYNVNDLHSVMAKTLDVSKVFPRVFLLEAYARPAETTLPMAVVETQAIHEPFELGNRSGHMWDVKVHILARMTGERKDLCDLIDKTMTGYLAFNDYSSGAAIFLQNAVIVDGRVRIKEYALKRDEFRQDSVIDNWSMVWFNLLTTL